MYEDIQYDLTRISYGRRGAFYYLGAWKEEDQERVYACALLSALDTAAPGRQARCGKLFPVVLQRNGEEIPYRATATPLCVTLDYEGGSARLCLQKGDILRIEASGVDVFLAPPLAFHEIAKTRNDGSWEVVMGPLPKLLFCPVKGTMEVTSGFDVIKSTPKETSFLFHPDETGRVDLAVRLYLSNAFRMREYPSFDNCIKEIEEEFAEYMKTVPVLPAEYESSRVLAAYLVWSHIIPIDGSDIIYMNKGIHRCTSNWQQCYHAMGQYRNPEFAWKLLLSMFYYQDEYGELPDTINDSVRSFSGTKPPLHGVALAFLSQYTDFSFVPQKERAFLYEGLARLVYWWLSYRDTDRDGIAQYDAADEAGWDDCSLFRRGVPAESPDLATYLILSMEQLAVLAGELGRFYEERMWKERAEEMLEKMKGFFWNGERFTSRLNETHEWVKCESLASFLPLLLGKRLPEEMIRKMAEALSEEGAWLTPYGLAGERLSSDHYREVGWLCGPVLAPVQLLICLGLRECGEEELARKIARRYCDALIRSGFPMIMNAKTGEDVSEGRWSTRYPNRMSWTAVSFLVLGSLFLQDSFEGE